MIYKFMKEALEAAEAARKRGNVPVGAVITYENKIIARGENGPDAVSHAELEAIRNALAVTGGRNLSGCDIYVTLEPCPMCTGAIINSRIPTVVFGARDAVTGSCGSVIDLFSESYGHRPAVFPGVLQNESSALLKDFFKSKR